MARAVLIYDGDCAACRSSALWIMRRALSRDELEILPYHCGPRRSRFPEISEDACRREMQVVLPDGRVLTGADAVPEILRRIRGCGWVGTVLSLPGARPLARRFYSGLARGRIRILCGPSAS